MADNYSFYLSADLNKYVGEWIAVVDGKIVCHDHSAKKAFDEAKKAFPNKIPFIACAPKHMAMIL